MPPRYLADWKKTQKGKVTYTHKKKPFTLMDARRIIIRVYLDRHEEGDGEVILDMMNLFCHWATDRRLLEEKFGVTAKKLDETFQWYINFIKWFDGFVSILSTALDALGNKIPILKTPLDFLATTIKIYNFVRKLFPIEE